MIKKVLRSRGMSPDDYVGSISEFAGWRSVRGYYLCSGQTIAVKGHEALFSIIGTKYGGNGRDNFNLPDLRPVDAKGNKIDWKDYSGPCKMICVEGYYPAYD